MKSVKYLIIPFVIALIIPVFVSAATSSDIQAQTRSLLQQIKVLQEQLATMQQTSAVWCHDFNVNLKIGDSGNEIKALQTALGKEGFPVMDIEENVQGYNYFGKFTTAAVSGFQEKYKDEILTSLGLKYGTGFVGKATRAKLNKLYGCVTTTTTPDSSIAVLSSNGGANGGTPLACSALSAYNGTTNDASAIIQSCINNSSPGQVVELPAGKYYIGTQINIADHDITLRTAGKDETMEKCSSGDSHDCAELIAMGNMYQSPSILYITHDNTTIDHIVINGNKSARESSAAGLKCQSGDNTHGTNISLHGSYSQISNSVSKEGLCASAIYVCDTNTTNIVLTKNTIINNGVHNKNGLWSDGVTAGDCVSSTFTENEFIDNTDIDLIFGGCQNCTVQNNTIRHTTSFAGGAFAGLMIHSWPSTSGNYTNTVFSNNFIDCGPQKRCGFGLYIGSDAWYITNQFGGSVHDNTIVNAGQGVNIDDAHDMQVYRNAVLDSGGPVNTNCGLRTGTSYNIGSRSYNIDTSLDNPPVTYSRTNWDGCIPNWWNAPEDGVSNYAQFVSQSVPTAMIAGQSYSVSVTMRNMGTATWTKATSYKLGAQNPQDNLTWGLGRVELTDGESVAPGQQKTFSFNITAPAVPGAYNFQWRIVQEFVEWFGEYTPNIQITVNQAVIAVTPLPPTGLSASCPSPGTSASLSWNAVSGATYYALRVDNTTKGLNDNPCFGTTGDYCNEAVSGTSIPVSTITGDSYRWWLHPCNAAGCNWTTVLGPNNFTCAVSTTTCIPSGDQNSINNVLTSVGSVAVLCRNAVFNLTAPVVFTAPNQQIYTQGLPTDSSRAVLIISSGTFAKAINGENLSGVAIKNIIINGNRPNLGYLSPQYGALISLGGDASGQVVDYVKAYEPRSWSTLAFSEGLTKNCSGAIITNNEIGPAGTGHDVAQGQWADGISLACRNSTVSGNTITDATDGAIVIFGSPGSLISGNTIKALTRTLFGGINMVDYAPFDGDYTNTRVTGNTIDAAGVQIVTGIAMGPRIWACPAATWPAGPNRGGTVTNNTLKGAHFAYGYVIDGVSNWTVSGNASQATHSGIPSGGCGQTPDPPQVFQKHGTHASGSFQTEFTEAYVESVLGVVPEGITPPPPTGLSASCPSPDTSATLSWNSGSGASYYSIRVDDMTKGINNNPCLATTGDYCNETINGTSITVPIIAGDSYHWWIHSRDSVGNWSDAQGSDFTCGTTPVIPYSLAVTKSGTGSGTVTSNPSGINCGSACAVTYTSGTSVTLTATPASGSTFAGWSGACSGTGTCTVSITQARNVTATFSIVSATNIQPVPIIPTSLNDFVSHLYTCVLERTPGQSEIDYWSNLLKSKTYTFEQEYQFFFDSQEYKLKNTSNDKYVNQLYRCILFRNPDQGGSDYWSNSLTNNTKTRIQEVNDFLASTEFVLGIKPKLDMLYILAFSEANFMASILETMQITINQIRATIEKLKK
ncbi:MAG: DUF4214 domain-containing protein [bacterium]|nr:DUF4214 domain-containing protein [bacterium]